MESMKANSPTLPPIPARTGSGRAIKRSGPVPAWGLKLGSAMATLAVFAGSFGFARANLYVTTAPLQPPTLAAAATGDATVATGATATAAPSTANTTTTTLTSSMRTTTRSAVTTTRGS
jgi:hypothetical protein